MSIWDVAYEALPDGEEVGSEIDEAIRSVKLEVRLRWEDIIANWSADPDVATMDLKDDVVLAEHISGFTGSGAVSMDSVPAGSTYGNVAISQLTPAGKVDILPNYVEYVSAVERYHSIPMAALRTGQEEFVATGDYVRLAAANDWVIIPVNLPHEAVMTKFKVYGHHNGGSNTINATLRRGKVIDRTTVDDIGTITSADTDADFAVEDTTLANNTITNATYQYYIYAVHAGGSGTIDIYGVKITYTVTEINPGAMF